MSPVSADQLKAYVERFWVAPQPTQQKHGRSSNGTFDIRAFIGRHLKVMREEPWKDGGHKWILSECPFNSDHTDKSAFVATQPSGAIVAGCQHHSCTWAWADLRELYEPKAMSRYPSPQKPAEQQPERVTKMLDTITVKAIKWLWPRRIPLGKVTIIEGDPDSGKSTITLDVAARVSSGAKMPFEFTQPQPSPAGVVLVCAEDDLEDTILPRILAAGGNRSLIGSVTLKRDEQGELIPMALPDDMYRLRTAIRECNAKLIVIDPITAYLNSSINSNNDPNVRRATTPLADLAQQTGCAVVLVRHLNKSGELKAKYRGGGSIAFTGAARSVLVVDKHPEEDGVYVMARVKGNLARANIKSVTYNIVEDEQYDCPKIVWRGTDKIDADTLLKGKDSRYNAPERKKAEEFLKQELADGPLKCDDVKKDASSIDITPKTLRNACTNLGIVTEQKRDANGKIVGWVWSLPKDKDDVGHLGASGRAND